MDDGQTKEIHRMEVLEALTAVRVRVLTLLGSLHPAAEAQRP